MVSIFSLGTSKMMSILSRRGPEISFDVHMGAGAELLFVFVISASAGVHGGDEHEICWVFYGATDSRDVDHSVFQGLSQNFQGFSGEFC